MLMKNFHTISSQLTLFRTVFLGNLIGTYVDNCQHAVFGVF